MGLGWENASHAFDACQLPWKRYMHAARGALVKGRVFIEAYLHRAAPEPNFDMDCCVCCPALRAVFGCGQSCTPDLFCEVLVRCGGAYRRVEARGWRRITKGSSPVSAVNVP
jgi:hypothetical protein